MQYLMFKIDNFDWVNVVYTTYHISFKINFSVIFPSMSWSPSWFLSLKISSLNYYTFLNFPVRSTWPVITYVLPALWDVGIKDK